MDKNSETDYSGEGFVYVVDKHYRSPICFGSKLHREVLPRRGPQLTGFMRRKGAEDTFTRTLEINIPPLPKMAKLGTMSKVPRWTVEKLYHPPPRPLSPPPPRKPTPNIPFNSSTPQHPQHKSMSIPGPGTYKSVYKKRQMKYNHSFGGEKIIVPAVDFKCVPYNTDYCAVCGILCGDQGDYWTDNKTFLCRRCCERQHRTHSKYSRNQLRNFKVIRDCAFAHHHELFKNSIKLFGERDITKRILREAYLGMFFSNIRDEKYSCPSDS